MKSVLLIAVTFLSAVSLANDTCVEVRGAIDIGSGSIKALVALVDLCDGQISKTLFDESRAIGYADAEKSNNGTLPKATVASGKAEISALILAMKKHAPTKISAVATSAFRTAKNGKEVIAQYSKDLEIPIEIISQEREAELGFRAALAAVKAKVSDQGAFVVWDIGGGSMQMIAKREGSTEVFLGKLASVSFKNRVIEELQKKDPKVVKSPNPIQNVKKESIELAFSDANANLPEFFKKVRTSARWIGIGGVLAHSVQIQAAPGKNSYTFDQLADALTRRSLLSDSELKGDYRETDVTNLALVFGYVKALGVTRIETAKVSLAQGLILQ